MWVERSEQYSGFLNFDKIAALLVRDDGGQGPSVYPATGSASGAPISTYATMGEATAALAGMVEKHRSWVLSSDGKSAVNLDQVDALVPNSFDGVSWGVFAVIDAYGQQIELSMHDSLPEVDAALRELIGKRNIL